MKKYKVIALSVGGLGNKIFRSGDIVSENNFLPGRADELVKYGFLKPEETSVIGNPAGEETTSETPVVSNEKSEEETAGESEKESEEGPEENQGESEKGNDPLMDEISVKELKEDLIKRQIHFKSNATKQELYNLWIQ